MRRARALPRSIETGVLVLGAGLAGMRAAWAARETAPGLPVTLVSPHIHPAGSSFANRNNALGLQAPTPDEAEAYADEALRLAAPGLVRRPLALALAEDAPARLAELLALGLDFRREHDSSLSRFPGCFSPAPRAVVFDGLARTHAVFTGRIRELGVEILHGYEALGLAQQEPGGRAAGAWLRPLRGGEPLLVRARAVVAALGGPAPLFARRICGPGGSGLGYGLLAEAGARLVNTGFLQWFWVERRTLGFVNPGELAWPGEMAGLALSRLGHCPAAHGLPDAALDLELLARRGRGGVVWATHRERGAVELVLAAHAGNGGALVDEQGRTTVRDLYACGECASGMHGANRMGGGMVLAALVFGNRAGRAAAREAGAAPKALPEPTGLDRGAGPGADEAFLAGLRRGMQRHGLPALLRRDDMEAPVLQAHREQLAGLAADAQLALRRRMLARSALAVLANGN